MDTITLSPLLLVTAVVVLTLVVVGAVVAGVRFAAPPAPARRTRGTPPEDAVSGYLQAQAQQIMVEELQIKAQNMDRTVSKLASETAKV